MGAFTFVPERNVRYTIRLEGHKDSSYDFPPVKDSGIVMQLVKNATDSLTLKLISSFSIPQPVMIRLQSRGIMLAGAAGLLKDSLILRLPIADVPQGLAEITLFDSQLQPLAERLVFLHPDRNMRIRVKTDKERYQSKEKVTLRITTTDPQGKPIPAVLSLRVRDVLMTDETNARDIVNYYQLSTQLRGRIHDPGYYFDSSNADRHEALDLLMLTQGWRRYVWNEEALKAISAHQRILPDSLKVNFIATRKAGKEYAPASIMLFNHDKRNMRPVVPGADGSFRLTPDYLFTGTRFFIKYFSEQEFKVKVEDPFNVIPSGSTLQCMPEELRPIVPGQAADTAFLQYGKRLQEVIITGKGRGFGDKYLGYLDSIAKYEGNFDYVGQCGILNCPACHSGSKPVEGRVYTEFKEEIKSKHATHPIPFTANDVRRVTYQYPKYTEEELMTKFKMIITKGYFQGREYYEPDYDREDKQLPDARNVIAWKPVIVTDKQGQATVSFYTSDIKGRFAGIVEGVDGYGLMGQLNLYFPCR